jgi:subtilisin family serine protease
MNPQVAPALPWRPDQTRLAMRGRLVVRMAPGHAPAAIAGHLAVRQGLAMAAGHLDGGPLDRVVRRFSPRMRVTRVFEPARHADALGGEGLWDDLEESLGLSRVLRLEVDPNAGLVDLAAALRDLAIVETVSPQYLCQTPFAGPAHEGPVEGPIEDVDDPPRDWGHRMVGAAEALAREPGDTALIAAVVDSGITHGHSELPTLRPGADFVDLPQPQVSRAVSLFGDIRDRDVLAEDEVGHGTACAGIIGGRGLFAPPGVGGACRLLPIRALAGAWVAGRAEPTALGSLVDIDAAVKHAVDLGARVLNLSFGTPVSSLAEGDPLPHQESISYALARGCLLVAASGNRGDDLAYYPAAAEGVIAVGAVGPDRRPTPFTSRGAHVALSAPGYRIHAPSLDGSYDRVTGTSFAAPFVTGACTLLYALARRRSQALDPALARSVLRDSARPFAGDAEGCGSGILDVPAALTLLDRQLERGRRFGAPNSNESDSPEDPAVGGVP